MKCFRIIDRIIRVGRRISRVVIRFNPELAATSHRIDRYDRSIKIDNGASIHSLCFSSVLNQVSSSIHSLTQSFIQTSFLPTRLISWLSGTLLLDSFNLRVTWRQVPAQQLVPLPVIAMIAIQTITRNER